MSKDIPVGYKLTEVGVIPEDWDILVLERIVDSNRPICYGIVQTGRHIDNGIKCIRVVDIENGKINEENLIKTSEAISYSYKRTILRQGDLVIALRGKIGELALIDDELVGSNLTRGVALIAPSEGYVSKYLLHYLSSPQSKKIFDRNLNGSALQEIPIGTLKKIPAVVPPLPEQEAIALVLSDTDALITSLDELIAKKRDIKQAAMQQLLTGKQRLEGFGDSSGKFKQTEIGLIPEEWEVNTIGEIFDVTAGGDFNPSFCSSIQDERHPYPIYSNAVTDYGLYGFCSYGNHPVGSITVTARGTLGVANFRNHQYTAIGRVLVLKPKIELNGQFFSCCINERINIVVESTGVPQLTAPQISLYKLAIPPFPEQKAIAKVLSDMDSAISALEQRRDKTKALKQAMMQELLTGRIRLL